MKPDINKLMEEARVAVKHASDKIADAHAEASVDRHPAREAIGHLRDLQEALYGLALYAQAQVRTHAQSLSQVMERTQAKKCFVVPTRERMAQEDMDVSPGSVRRAILREHFQALPKQGVRSAETLAGPEGSRVPMTDADRDTEQMLKWRCAKNPDYEWVWDAPPGSPEWTPVSGKVHTLSNGNVAYVFDAGPDRRRTERAVEKRTLAMVNKFGKDVKKEHIKLLRKAAAVHKTCPSWGETQCGLSFFSACAPKAAIFKWKGVTCKECLKLRGVRMPRDKGVKQAVRAAKRKMLAKRKFVDNGDVKQKWVDPQPSHPNRFYLLVNGKVKKCQAGNGYFTIQQARRLQKKLTRPGVKVQVGETYLHR